MRKLRPREIVILSITLALVVFFVIYELAIKPGHEGAVDIDEQLHTQKAQLLKASSLVARDPAVEAMERSLEDLLGTVDSDQAQMPTIISKIETAARDNNIHIANIQPQRSSTQKNVMFITVELDIDAQWQDIVRFLYVLQQRPNFYFINELNLEKYSAVTNSLRGRIVVARPCLIKS